MSTANGRRPARDHEHVTARGATVALAVLLSLLALPAATAGTMSLRWDPVSDASVTGYRVHYGSSPTALTQSKDAGASTLTDLTGLSNCSMWYAVVRAYDGQGLESSDGNQVRGWPRPIVNTVTPTQIQQGTTVTFTVAGTNFDPGETGNPNHPAATVELSASGLTVDSVRVDACGQVRVTVTASAGAPLGLSDLTVKNPDLSHASPGVHPWVFGTKDDAIQIVAPNPSDTTPPTVAGTAPIAGATEVDPAVRPTVTFSEIVDPATVNASTVRLLDASGAVVPQAAGWPTTDGAIVTIRPAAALAFEATYRIAVTGGSSGVKDLAGNALATNFTQTPGFTIKSNDQQTPAEPQVQSAVPSAGATQIDIDTTTARLTFDRDMSALGSVFSAAELKQLFWVSTGALRIDHASGSPSFENGGRTVVIRLASPLQAGGSYVTNANLSGASTKDRLTDAGHADLAMTNAYATNPAWATQDGVTRVDYNSEDGGASGTLTPSSSVVPDENSGVPVDSAFSITFAQAIAEDSLGDATIRIVKPANEAAMAIMQALRTGANAAGISGTSAGGIASLVSRVQQMLFQGRIENRFEDYARDATLEVITLSGSDTSLSPDGRTLRIKPSESLRAGELYELLIEGGAAGVHLMTENGETYIQAPEVTRVPFYTEVNPETQDVTLGVGQ